MDRISHAEGIQVAASAPVSTGEKRWGHPVWRVIGIILWCIGFIILMAASVTVHGHPGPWPFELTTSHFIQNLHLWAWILACLTFVNVFNNGAPAAIELAIWFIVLLILRQYRYAIFIALGAAIADGLDGLLEMLVHRPRPSPHLVHILMPEPTPSFPSGHVEHCVVYYGFLLYLSFSRPIRQWRYSWLLIPLQLFAALTILVVGFARLYAGSHWLSDVVAGYLSGALLLIILILLYRWAVGWLARRRARKQREKEGQALSSQER
jgi:membrane-associated phospholipid phosphatase